MICRHCGKEMLFNEDFNTWVCKECIKSDKEKFSMNDLQRESKNIKIIPFTKGLDSVVEKLKCSGDNVYKFYILYMKFKFEGNYMISEKICGDFKDNYEDFGWDYAKGSKLKEINKYNFELAEVYDEKLLKGVYIKEDENEILGILKRFRREKAKDIGRMYNIMKNTKNDEFYSLDDYINVEKAEKESYYLPVYVIKDYKRRIVYVINGQSGQYRRENWKDEEKLKERNYKIRYYIGCFIGIGLYYILRKLK